MDFEAKFQQDIKQYEVDLKLMRAQFGARLACNCDRVDIHPHILHILVTLKCAFHFYLFVWFVCFCIPNNQLFSH